MCTTITPNTANYTGVSFNTYPLDDRRIEEPHVYYSTRNFKVNPMVKVQTEGPLANNSTLFKFEFAFDPGLFDLFAGFSNFRIQMDVVIQDRYESFHANSIGLVSGAVAGGIISGIATSVFTRARTRYNLAATIGFNVLVSTVRQLADTVITIETTRAQEYDYAELSISTTTSIMGYHPTLTIAASKPPQPGSSQARPDQAKTTDSFSVVPNGSTPFEIVALPTPE